MRVHDVVAGVAAVPSVAEREAKLVDQPGVVTRPQQAADGVGRYCPGPGERQHVGLVARASLGLSQVVHVQLDAATSGKVGVRHVEDAHEHLPSSHAAPAGRL